MKLGIAIDWAGAELKVPVDKVQLAERLGFDSVWTAEAYGSDAITPLAYLAAHTQRIRLGTSIAQIAARTPASAAMQMATVDALAGGGRVIAGFGLSGPQIVEGWYGQPWGRPNHRMRDYVEIVRKVFRREGPVEHEGREISLPFRGEGSSGLGKPLKCILHTNPDIPIWLGTGNEANVKLTAELADGWLPFGFAPGMLETYRPWLEEGFRRAGGGKSLADFEIQAGCQVVITDDIRAAIDERKAFIGFYVGGMGAKSKNFHKDLMARRGFPKEADRIQELFLAGHRQEAFATVPDEYIDDAGLIGPVQRIKERYSAWADCGATGLTLHTANEEAMELMADLAGTRP